MPEIHGAQGAPDPAAPVETVRVAVPVAVADESAEPIRLASAGDVRGFFRERGEAPRKRDTVVVQGKVITLQALSTGESEEYRRVCMVGVGRAKEMDEQGMRSKLLVRTIIDPVTGNRVFTNEETAIIDALELPDVEKMFKKASDLLVVSEKKVEDKVGES